MKSAFLAFDLGASSGRAIVGLLENGKLELTEVHRFDNAPIEKSGEFFWDYPALCAELEKGLEKALEKEKNITSIAIDTWGVDYVLFDSENRMKRLPYCYRDERSVRHEAELHKIISPAELYRESGIQDMSINTVYQLFAHKCEHPEDFEDARFLTMPDALALSLGGDFTAEYTHCSTTALLDPNIKNWNWKLIKKLGLPESIFPEVVMPCQGGGLLSEDISKRLGCDRIPIIKIGSHDTASAVGAVPIDEKDGDSWAYLSCGTWALLGAELREPMIVDFDPACAFTNEGGLDNTIRFLSNITGCWLIQELRREWRKDKYKNCSFADLEKMARSTENKHFIFNPNHPSLSAPGAMEDRIRKRIVVENNVAESEIDDSSLVCAIYDSLANAFAERLKRLARLTRKDFKKLMIIGGGIQDSLLMQKAANVTQIEISAGPVEATAAGNILAQAVAAGLCKSWNEARKIVRNSFTPEYYKPENSKTPSATVNDYMERIYKSRLTTVSGGNLSVILPDGTVWITPSGIDKGTLTERDIMKVTSDGEITGLHRPSVEYPFHRAIFNIRPDIKAILHAHPPALVAFSAAKVMPDTDLICNFNRNAGKIGFAPYAIPGSAELGEKIAKSFAEGNSSVILENHGVVLGASDMSEAFTRFEMLNRLAETEYAARLIGTPRKASECEKGNTSCDTIFEKACSAKYSNEIKNISEYALRACRQRLFASGDGMIALRVENGFLCTIQRCDRAKITCDDIVFIDCETPIENLWNECAFALHVFKNNPDVNCVMLAAPPHAMGYAVSDAAFDPKVIPESYLVLREVPRFSCCAFDEAAKTLSARYPAIMIENCAIALCGVNIGAAFDRLEVFEFTAEASIMASRLGGMCPMNEKAVNDIVEAFKLIP